jgi:nucleotide-binding universal stress UspA family protein
MWSFPPSRILVPVDFGEASGRAVAVASALASRVGGQLHLLHAEVLEVPAYFTHDQVRALERERQLARSRAREFLRDFGQRHGVSQFTSRIDEGMPTAIIVDSAAEADMVVMGTHGRRGPARWWIGSVAERVIHQSPAPVLVVRAGEDDLAAESVFERPMIMASSSADVGLARRVAAGLASAFGGHVADGTAACQADLARDRGATIVVVPGAARHGALHAHPAEHWLRSCPLPMLFIPGPVFKTAQPESLN